MQVPKGFGEGRAKYTGMRRSLPALALLVALSAVSARAGAQTVPCSPVPLVDDRCERWVAIYDHPGGHGTTGIDMAFDTVTDGTLVYVTGQSWADQKDHYDFATIAYDAATGAQRWLSRYDGPGDEHDIPQSMVLSPDKTRLYITGWVHMNPVGEGSDYATIALDAATGDLLWDATYEGPDEGDDAAYGVAVSPDGEWVYVTGKSGIGFENMDFATIAYRADSGEEAWVSRFSLLPGAGEDAGISPVVSPDGKTVYVTGAAGTTWATLAYRAGEAVEGEPEPGTLLWSATDQKGYAYWIALSPDGDTVYATGSKHFTTGGGLLLPNWDYATVAYDAATGTRRWEATYAAPNPGLDVPFAHALSPSGDRIYLTGSSRGTGHELNTDLVTVAFDTADGHLVWSHRDDNPALAFEGGGDVVVSPDGSRVYAGGWSAAGFGAPGLGVVRAYTEAGTVAWSARYNGVHTADENVFIDAVAIAPDGGTVYATGRAQYGSDPSDPANQQPGTNSVDIVTLAYATA